MENMNKNDSEGGVIVFGKNFSPGKNEIVASGSSKQNSCMTLSNKGKSVSQKQAPLRQKKPVAESKKTKDDWTDVHQNALPLAYEKHKDTPAPKIWSDIRDDDEFPMFANFDTRAIRMRYVPMQDKLKGVSKTSGGCADKLTVSQLPSNVGMKKVPVSGAVSFEAPKHVISSSKVGDISTSTVVSVDKSKVSGVKAIPSSFDAPKRILSAGNFVMVGDMPEISSMENLDGAEQPLTFEDKIILKINGVLDLKKEEMVKYVESEIENLKQGLGLALKNLLQGQNGC